jgi:hypothetical protein
MIRWSRARGLGLSPAAQGQSSRPLRWGAARTTTGAGALALSGGHYFEAVALTGQRVTANLGLIRDPGHAEPWIMTIACPGG